MDKVKLAAMFDDWALHNEDWGETEIVASWESQQAQRTKEASKWFTRED